jgi:hypothetical protein
MPCYRPSRFRRDPVAPGRSAVSGLAALRAAWGAALLISPAAVAAKVTGPPDRRVRAVARLLGARHVLQAAVTSAEPTAAVVVAGVLADALHALSMVAVAAVDRGHRRVALVDAGIAGGFALAGWLGVGHGLGGRRCGAAGPG